ncbi:MoaD/ThiS family protein [Oceanobacillus massiliensis]|uniref:MoaD/ThiS family protein n=1 Tax=Oceanobacillus massiliensis TaxID=1465765 RepID=UPI000288D209|nr:MoaD/ThiS family protein [Oceanobacillus massiliensis]
MITILLFAQLQEQAGRDKLEVEIERLKADNMKADKIETITVADLKHFLQQRYSLVLEHAMTAINEEYAVNDDSVQAGDTVAFIPPVSGG